MQHSSRKTSLSSWAGEKNGERRVAFVVHNMNVGGVQRVWILLAREFIKLGWRVDFVLVRNTGGFLDELPVGSAVIDLRASRLLKALPGIRKYLHQQRPDLVISSIWPLTSITVLAAVVAGYKGGLISSEHSTLSLSPIGRGLQGAMLRMSMRMLNGKFGTIVAVSEGVRADLIKLGAPADRVRTIHNPVEVDVLGAGAVDSTPLPQVWRNRPKALRFLAVGRIKDAKDYPMMFEALRLVVADGIDAGLVIAGDGPDRLKMEALCDGLGLRDHIQFVGDVTALRPLYQNAGRLLFSSKYEGFGNVLVEALSAGLPVVSTNCNSGPSEILRGGALGALTPVGDPHAFAAAIKSSISKHHDPEVLRARSLDFKPSLALEQYLEVFCSLSSENIDGHSDENPS